MGRRQPDDPAVASPPAAGGRPRTPSRARLLDLSVGLVEDVRSPGEAGPAREQFSAQFQVALPYQGLFVWHVGDDEVVGDANQALFVTGGEGYRMTHPVEGGYGELIVTPTESVMAELAHTSGGVLEAHPLFRRRSRRLTTELQGFRARFLGWARHADTTDGLASEEIVLSLLRAALDDHGRRQIPGRSTARLIRRTKAFLEAELTRPIRLTEVGRAVGASPLYLTQVFRAVEGIPLHGYLNQLRLARALTVLPHADDLTALALDVGFSSHSHFSAKFRRAFGTTPSQFRQLSRLRVRPALA
jgi:AraC family transcriptional regulator